MPQTLLPYSSSSPVSRIHSPSSVCVCGVSLCPPQKVTPMPFGHNKAWVIEWWTMVESGAFFHAWLAPQIFRFFPFQFGIWWTPREVVLYVFFRFLKTKKICFICKTNKLSFEIFYGRLVCLSKKKFCTFFIVIFCEILVAEEKSFNL